MKVLITAILMVAIFFAGCKSMNKSQKGAVIGSVGGGAVGAVIGKATGNTVLGVIIGAAVGGVTGAVIGRHMDKQAEDIKNDIPEAVVVRVGEGILIEFNNKILFGFDQSDLSAEAKTNLDKLVVILQKYPDTNIEVQGHTDNTGTVKYNKALSERRAYAVASYLSGYGIPSTRVIIAPARLSIIGFGETQPKYLNNTADGQLQNRRVEFLVTANDKMKADAAREAAAKGG
jgi:outer membrane protein OmpA-like peptidoglycan-associated protein